MIDLILGGARSGKSAYAESLALTWQSAVPLRQVVYVATAEAHDDEMRRRVAHHQQRRPDTWALVESALNMPEALQAASQPDTLLLVDCLTLWLSNLLFAGDAARQAEQQQTIDCPLLVGRQQALIDVLPTLPGPVVLVSNEVGWGIVPMAALSRLFADEQGRLNQRVAAIANRVTLVAAGLPLVLKPH